ncbi:hypothetical protein CUMW_142310 [Citrus unshiu]|nr:hypothetical protein CUMW_142310 [Citrus unshiu]
MVVMHPPLVAETTVTSSSISTVHPDIMENHIFKLLDASALASASCVSSQLYSLASDETLWTNFCNSTWPSTDNPRIRRVISSFPKGPRAFFSDAVTNPDTISTTTANSSSSSPVNLDRTSRLISAVDIYYQKRHVFSKVVETESFGNRSPFRVELLDPRDTVPARIPYPVDERMMLELGDRFTLSWILIDPVRRRAMNLSSYKPVIVERRWLPGEQVHMRYGWVFNSGPGEEGSATEYVKFGISLTWEECQSGVMHVTGVSLDLEDMYGNQMSGKESLAIIQKGMVGNRGSVKGREEEGRRRYEEYMEMRRERILSVISIKEPERFHHSLYVAFRLFIFATLGLLLFRRFF